MSNPAGGPDRYLDGLPGDQQDLLKQVNSVGLASFKELLAEGSAVAFLGAGVSVPLYPLWDEVIARLIDGVGDRLTPDARATCMAMRRQSPDAVMEVLRRRLGAADYHQRIREVFRPERHPVTKRTWTPLHELVVRCNFAGVITTNYDTGIVNARMAVRPDAPATGFASWDDEEALDRWRRDEIYEDELPVLYAHGHHNRPNGMVLATTEYRHAYSGKLARVLDRLFDGGHLVWIGFSFADQRIRAILREVDEAAGTAFDPGGAPRHVALVPWDPEAIIDDHGLSTADPDVLRTLVEIDSCSRVILYPAPGGDHSALSALLEDHTDPRFSAVLGSGGSGGAPKGGSAAESAGEPLRQPGFEWRWVHGGVAVEHFTGRAEELERLDRWAADSQVRLIGVTAWGGAGKTALATEWMMARGWSHREGVRGLFAWSFYENRSADEWARAFLEWVDDRFGVRPQDGALAHRVVAAVKEVPLVLLLDGLEVLQEGPAASQYGRLLDGTLRTVLTTICEAEHGGLVLLTSRFPFADLEQFDGRTTRMLDVPPFTPVEGAELLARSGVDWLSEQAMEELVRVVDGHALAVGALAGALSKRPGDDEMIALKEELTVASRTDDRVAGVLRFYSDSLGDTDRRVVALVSLFQRPVAVDAILTLDKGEKLSGLSGNDVEAIVRQRLFGLLTWHPDGAVSAHPLVRDTFRRLALTGPTAQLATDLSLADLPEGRVTDRDAGLRVVEMIELLVEAGEWRAADELATARTDNGRVWKALPASRLGQRYAMAFVASEQRRRECAEHLSPDRLGFYLNEMGLFSTIAGDLATAVPYLEDATEVALQVSESHERQATVKVNLAECYHGLGHAARIQQAATAAREMLEGANGLAFSVMIAIGYQALALDLQGDSLAADSRYVEADRMLVEDDPDGDHLYGLHGCLWSLFLIRTGRHSIARRLLDRGREVADERRWFADIARCDSVLAACDLEDGDIDRAGERLESAMSIFRDGDNLVHLSETLVELAEQRRRDGRLDEAEQLCAQTTTLAAPRGLVPNQVSALAVRARIRADRFGEGASRAHLEQARDDADHVLHLATKVRQLPWLERSGVEVHATLDALEGRDRGWRSRLDDLTAKLVPEGLEPDPLDLVERQLASRLAEESG